MSNKAGKNTPAFFSFRIFDQTTTEIFQKLNCRAPFHLAQLFLPTMRTRGAGWILDISSAVAQSSTAPFTPFERDRFPLLYGMSKAALDLFTLGLAAENYGKIAGLDY